LQIILIEVECHISIKKDGNCFLNVTKTELLQEIMQSGSLNCAVKKLKISYQHAWNLIDEMNQVALEPLVTMQRGGTNGGGAVISVYGKRILGEYRQIQAQFNTIVNQINVAINL
jgi:molybdate transport system regulatory protein